ncbi:MAG: tRNA pseudouridine(55) synthase TruB [Tissierellia bacterium]|nr:tRNA pseudouridine(55) synthase TruB [Tissierellia bacterium]
MNGILNVFKPKGITSHDVVDIARRIFGIKRIGHTGTLDPNATGVLVLCIGRATRISEYLLDLDKEYVGEIRLGLATDTQDELGKVLSRSSKRVSIDEIYRAFDSFKGKIDQVPPMYSALKHRGKKLYEIARKGGTIERKPREVEIYELKVLNIIEAEKIIFYTRCSKGTYIRTLCDDIGEFLGTYGYMSYLMRTGVGNFQIAESHSLEYLMDLDKRELKKTVHPMDTGLTHLNAIRIDDGFYRRLVNGAIIYLQEQDAKDYDINIPLRVYCNGSFIGIGRILEENMKSYLKMDKVLI